MKRNASLAGSRGFTLVELMTVVVIVGVLATIGIASFRARIFGSKTSEAFAMIQSIRAAQERYRAENLTYLNVTQSSDGWWPAAPDGMKRAFYATAANCTADSLECRWKRLNPATIGPVEFGYKVSAGMPSEAKTEPTSGQEPEGWTGWGPSSEHWFVVQAIADRDQDGELSYLIASNTRADVFHVNDGE